MPHRTSKPAIAGVSPVLITHLHPLVLLASYFIQFPSLVESPPSALVSSFFPLAAIQIAYAVLCLSDSSGSSSSSSTEKKLKTGGFRPKKADTISSGGLADQILVWLSHELSELRVDS